MHASTEDINARALVHEHSWFFRAGSFATWLATGSEGSLQLEFFMAVGRKTLSVVSFLPTNPRVPRLE